MHHYVALVDPYGTAQGTREADRLLGSYWETHSGWQLIVRSDTLRVYSGKQVDAAMRPYCLPNGLGVIFGRLFFADRPHVPVEEVSLPAGDSALDIGRKILACYWGSYVAILRSRDESSVVVFRDPSGRIPCYYTEASGAYVFFSDIRDIAPLGLRFSLNERYLAAYILHQPLHVTETGLREVSEILAGDAVSIGNRQVSVSCLWNPRLIARDAIIADCERAKQELTAATETVVRQWASVYDRILLNISGGLDSAIVLGCLKRLGLADRVTGLNRYTEGTEDDERSYARSAAALAGIRLLELPRVSDARAFVTKLACIPPDPSPDLHKAMKMLAADSTNAIAASYHCDTVWSGQGGDHLFLQSHMPYGAADYLRHHVFSHRFPRLLYESALLSRRSIWTVLADATRHTLRPGSIPAEPFENCGTGLMTTAAAGQVPRDYIQAHWHRGGGRVLPGKQIQIDMLSDLLNRHKPLVSIEHPYPCNPLVSQPLLDVALRIPTYHLLMGGRQRGLARAAFSDRVPACILNREDKGGTMDQVRTLLRGSGPLLRETLLDGTLVSIGILDRASLERIIVDQETYRVTEVFAIFASIAAEMWARHWTARTRTLPEAPAALAPRGGTAASIKSFPDIDGRILRF